MANTVSLSAITPADLPSPPGAAIRVVHACTRDESNSRQLGELIGRDPVLTAELLRIANSAFFGFRAKVKSAANAVSLLGSRALRNLAMCMSMRDALRAKQIPGLPVAEYWEDALRRAVAAAAVGGRVGLDKDECFTAGLLQDFGMLVILHAQQHRASYWKQLRTSLPDARYELEVSLFQITHDKVGAMLAEAWSLPDELRVAIAQHHAPVAGAVGESSQRMAEVMHCADWIAAVFTAEDKRGALARARSLMAQRLDLDEAAAMHLMDEIGSGVEEAGQAMGMQVGNQLSFDEVLREANLRLVEENLSIQELVWQLENTLEERDQIAAELNHELELAREVQRSLIPTEREQDSPVYGINLPAREVSGDFYDYFTSRDGRLQFCIADVSGKGMNAALLMAKAASLFRCLGKGLCDPARLLTMLNREIYETSVRGMFVTMIAGSLDPETGEVQLVNAGHLPALQLLHRGGVKEFVASAVPLGILPEAEFIAERLSLTDGPVYMCTDGVLEAETKYGAQLERHGLLRLIRSCDQVEPRLRMPRILDSIRNETRRIHDDVTLMMLTNS